MKFELLFTPQAELELEQLRARHSAAVVDKAVEKILGYMQEDIHHPSLHTHEYHEKFGPHGEKVFEAYAQQHTPGAYRIFWYYGPSEAHITILSIVHHPE